MSLIDQNIIHGRLLKLSIGANEVNNLSEEKDCTLTIETSYTKGASDSRCVTNHKQTKNWSLDGQFLMTDDYSQFSTLFNAIKNGQSVLASFSGNYQVNGDNHGILVRGYCIITSMSFAGQGSGLVNLNIKMQGSGKPTRVSFR